MNGMHSSNVAYKFLMTWDPSLAHYILDAIIDLSSHIVIATTFAKWFNSVFFIWHINATSRLFKSNFLPLFCTLPPSNVLWSHPFIFKYRRWICLTFQENVTKSSKIHTEIINQKVQLWSLTSGLEWMNIKCVHFPFQMKHDW